MTADPSVLPPGFRGLPVGERFAAAVVDFLVLLVIEVIVAIPMLGPAYSPLLKFTRAHRKAANLSKNPHYMKLVNHLLAVAPHYGIVIAIITAVYLIAMYLTTGATLGKLALGLRVTRTDGRPLTVRDAVLRSIPFWLANPFLPVFGVWLWLLQYIGGTLVLLFRPDHRGTEDLLGRSMVVRATDRGHSLAELTSPGPPSAPPLRPPDAASARGGHLPGWGPASEPPPSPTDGEPQGSSR
ncbi:MAG: RDD family protein [Candidatus Dormibacteria bacterium]